MFNFEEFENVTNKQLQVAVDVKVFAGNKIRIGDEAAKKLNLTEDRRLVITRNPKNNQVAIYSTAQEGLGRSINKNREFSHQSVAHILGGQHSEWEITGDGMQNPATGDVWFGLTQTVNGEEERNKLAELANETEETVDASVPESTVESTTESLGVFDVEE